VRGPSNSVYLVGSVHVLPRSAYPLPAIYDRAFTDSEQVIFEVDPDVLDSAEAGRELERAGLYPRGDSLEKHVSPQTWQVLLAFFESAKIDEEKAKRMKAWMLADLLESAALEAAGFEFDLGIDNHYARRARRSGKPIGALEQLRDQSALMTSISDREAEERLLATLLHADEIVRQIDRLCRRWRKGDAGHVAKLLEQQDENNLDYHRAMFRDRNRRWLPKIEAFTRKKDDYLVVVGAGHLVGPDGIVALLRARGVLVEPL
jgi:uncharacterized protein YbaP (TraB family)